ncbi:MAG: magnesium/cobalt transporter CorA [archaeon]
MLDIFFLDKTLKRVSIEEVRPGRMVWVDASNLAKGEQEWLTTTFSLHPLTAEDIYNSHVRVKVEQFPGYLFSVFYAINEKKLDQTEVDFVLGKNFLITNHSSHSELFKKAKEDNTSVNSLDFLFHKLLDSVVDSNLLALEAADDIIESLEEEAISSTDQKILVRIMAMKRKIARLRKTALSQRDKISFLAKQDYPQISKRAIPYFRDIYDHSIRVSDSLENHREALGNVYDVYVSTISNRMNEVMKTLSIIATIALPLGIISGIYGTNFIRLPGSSAEAGFWYMIGGMALLVFGMLVYFRKRHWF